MKFTKEDARRRVLNCAKQYQQKLLNKKLIIIYRERQDNVYVPSKSVDTDIYSTVKHVAKGLNLNNITLPQDINAMINLDNYIYRGK